MNNPGDDWTDEQLDRLTPDETSIRLAKTFVLGWATGDRQLMNTAIAEAFNTGRPLKFLGAHAEWISQGLNLRDDQAAIDAVREEIARHLANENGCGTTPPKGDQ